MTSLILLMLLTTSALADVKTCNDFVEKVLKPAVTFDEKTNDHGYRFAQDETKALTFIKSYDVSKLQLKEEINLTTREINDCKVLNDPKTKDQYCISLFENFNYLRGLLYGTRNYNWKPSTIELARKDVKSYLEETTTPGVPLVYMAISFAILNDLSPSEEVKAERAKLEKVIAEGQKYAREHPAKDCASIQRSMKNERQKADVFRLKLAEFLKEKK